MMKTPQRPPIAFDLLANAKDSFAHAIQLIGLTDIGSEHGRLKQAILSAAHCIELLFKERLRLVHPAFVWEKVEQYPSLDARTITVDLAIRRLKSLANVSFTPNDEATLSLLRLTRNKIEHYEWHTTEREAKVIVGKALSFALSFAEDELRVDLASEHQRDDTWKTFLNELFEFALEHGRRLEQKLTDRGVPLADCTECGGTTVSVMSGICSLCGHWQFDEGDGEA